MILYFCKPFEAAIEWEELEPDSGDAAACVCREAFKCGKMDIANLRLEKCAGMHYYVCASLRKEMRGH